MIAVDHPQGRVLVTIPISHYCEKARWALTRAGLPFTEQPHVQLVHRLAARRAGGGRTVPVLLAPDGVFADSRAILFYADARGPAAGRLYPGGAAAREQVIALEERFDTVLAPEGRRWMYHQSLAEPRAFVPYNVHGVPRWEARAFPVLLPFVGAFVRRYLDVDAATASRAEDRIDAELDAVAARLADGRPYLTGEHFTAADLAFAALAAPVVLPPEYGVPLPGPDQVPPAMRARVRAWRAHPAGAFALRLYAEQRRAPGAQPAA